MDRSIGWVVPTLTQWCDLDPRFLPFVAGVVAARARRRAPAEAGALDVLRLCGVSRLPV
jgi:hypothetical protein